MSLYTVRIAVNGREYSRQVEPRLLLSDFLRDELGLHGTHVGCEQGVCGACTVLLDGEPIRSCLTLAVQVNGQSVSTVEGLASEGALNPLQQAFTQCHALQCGFCTPGFLMTLTAFLRDHPEAGTDEEIREALSGNLCRCTGYQNIVEAVRMAAASQAGKGERL